MRLRDENFTQDHVRGWPFDFWGGGGGYRLYGLFQKKISYTLISREKNSCKEIPGKIILHWKKIPFMAYNAGKNLTVLYVRKKNFHQRFGEKYSYPIPNQERKYCTTGHHHHLFSLCVTANFTGYSRLLGEETSRNHQAYREATSTSQYYKK